MSSRKDPTVFFTVESANSTLPLVRRITEDLAGLSGEIIDRQTRLVHLAEGRDLEADDPYSEELVQVQAEIEKDRARLTEFMREILELGAEPKNGPGGVINLVDFPGHRNGELVYLCWQLGEPEVKYWHPLDAGFAGRTIIVPDEFAEQVSSIDLASS